VVASGLSEPHLLAQIGAVARRSVIRTIRQRGLIAFPILFPLILFAINGSALSAATKIPGFPPVSYRAFLLAVPFMQGALFVAVTAGVDLARDIESGFFNRLALTPLRRVSLIAGLLLGVAVLGALQSIVYILMGFIGGDHLAAGVGGALVIVVLGSLAATAFGTLGCVAALRTGSGEVVQGLFPLFFVFIFLSSGSLPRPLLRTGWFHTVATWNPISYLIEGFRSLFVVGWDGTSLWRGFAVAIGIALLGLVGVVWALRGRLQRT
jgi:ABC-2 type transport system permease protein